MQKLIADARYNIVKMRVDLLTPILTTFISIAALIISIIALTRT